MGGDNDDDDAGDDNDDDDTGATNIEVHIFCTTGGPPGYVDHHTYSGNVLTHDALKQWLTDDEYRSVRVEQLCLHHFNDDYAGLMLTRAVHQWLINENRINVVAEEDPGETLVRHGARYMLTFNDDGTDDGSEDADFHVGVRLEDGTYLDLMIYPSDTVGDIRRRVSQEEPLELTLHRVWRHDHPGRAQHVFLPDNAVRFDDYNFSQGDYLTATLRR
eukprot:3333290-Heterocapsa_arctica.AAC.1